MPNPCYSSEDIANRTSTTDPYHAVPLLSSSTEVLVLKTLIPENKYVLYHSRGWSMQNSLYRDKYQQ
jgi:hypothetical protein